MIGGHAPIVFSVGGWLLLSCIATVSFEASGEIGDGIGR
jgi:hypothetical protein